MPRSPLPRLAARWPERAGQHGSPARHRLAARRRPWPSERCVAGGQDRRGPARLTGSRDETRRGLTGRPGWPEADRPVAGMRMFCVAAPGAGRETAGLLWRGALILHGSVSVGCLLLVVAGVLVQERINRGVT